MSHFTYADRATAPAAVTSPFTTIDVRHLPRRAGASLVDLFILSTMTTVFFVMTAHVSHMAYIYNSSGQLVGEPGTYYSSPFGFTGVLATAAAVYAYYAFMEWALGWTLGKLVFGLRVVDFAGGSISFAQSLGRNLVRIVDAIPGGLYFVGWVVAIRNDRRQRWGDKAAGTLVVSRQACARAQSPAAIGPIMQEY